MFEGQVEDIQSTGDDGYIVGGFRHLVQDDLYSESNLIDGHGLFLSKLSKTGEVSWTNFVECNDACSVSRVVEMSSGNFVLCGRVFGRFSLFYYDEFGTGLWNKTFGEVDESACEGVVEEEDGQILAAGWKLVSNQPRALIISVSVNGTFNFGGEIGTSGGDSLYGKIFDITIPRPGFILVTGYLISDEDEWRNLFIGYSEILNGFESIWTRSVTLDAFDFVGLKIAKGSHERIVVVGRRTELGSGLKEATVLSFLDPGSTPEFGYEFHFLKIMRFQDTHAGGPYLPNFLTGLDVSVHPDESDIYTLSGYVESNVKRSLYLQFYGVLEWRSLEDFRQSVASGSFLAMATPNGQEQEFETSADYVFGGWLHNWHEGKNFPVFGAFNLGRVNSYCSLFQSISTSVNCKTTGPCVDFESLDVEHYKNIDISYVDHHTTFIDKSDLRHVLLVDEVSKACWECYMVGKDDDDVCSGHGVCRMNGTCDCQLEYDNDEICMGYECYGYLRDDTENVCSGHGDCVELDTCSCIEIGRNTGYFGDICDIVTCGGYFSNDTNVCGGYGICKDYNECEPPTIFSNIFTYTGIDIPDKQYPVQAIQLQNKETVIVGVAQFGDEQRMTVSKYDEDGQNLVFQKDIYCRSSIATEVCTSQSYGNSKFTPIKIIEDEIDHRSVVILALRTQENVDQFWEDVMILKVDIFTQKLVMVAKYNINTSQCSEELFRMKPLDIGLEYMTNGDEGDEFVYSILVGMYIQKATLTSYIVKLRVSRLNGDILPPEDVIVFQNSFLSEVYFDKGELPRSFNLLEDSSGDDVYAFSVAGRCIESHVEKYFSAVAWIHRQSGVITAKVFEFTNKQCSPPRAIRTFEGGQGKTLTVNSTIIIGEERKERDHYIYVIVLDGDKVKMNKIFAITVGSGADISFRPIVKDFVRSDQDPNLLWIVGSAQINETSYGSNTIPFVMRLNIYDILDKRNEIRLMLFNKWGHFSTHKEMDYGSLLSIEKSILSPIDRFIVTGSVVNPVDSMYEPFDVYISEFHNTNPLLKDPEQATYGCTFNNKTAFGYHSFSFSEYQGNFKLEDQTISTEHYNYQILKKNLDQDLEMIFTPGLHQSEQVCWSCDGINYNSNQYPGIFTNTSLCYDRGVCLSHDNCSCYTEGYYFGRFCEKFKCFGVSMLDVVHVCHGHGACYALNECDCEEGYYGDDCAHFKCNDTKWEDVKTVCSGHGKCIALDTCDCDTNYTEQFCSEWKCYGMSNTNDGDKEKLCSGKGKCIAFNNCTCSDYNYYTGENCQYWTCFNTSVADVDNVCSGHGTCISHDKCLCVSGYDDVIPKPRISVCDEWSCSGFPKYDSRGCNNRGVCTDLNECECDVGYTGPFCELVKCGVFDETEYEYVCSGHGRCVAKDICLCDSFFYSGSECEDASMYFYVFGIPGISASVLFLLFLCICCACCILMFFCLLFVIGVFIMMLMCSMSRRVIKQGGRITKYQKLKDFDILLQEQLLHEEKNENDFGNLLFGKSRASSFKINTKLFHIKRSELDLVKIIGQGGSASTVYLSKYKGSMVAFKRFKSYSNMSLFIDKRTYEEFEKELNIMSSISHPYILRFLGCCLEEKCVGIVTEFCQLGDLRNFLTDQPKSIITLMTRIIFLFEISSAMEFLHERDIVHRDLKPENVLVSDDRHCRVMDFGLSRVLSTSDEDLQTNKMSITKGIGTSIFMAPEITRGDDYDNSCDVFSFAIMVWEILTLNFTPFADRKEEEQQKPQKITVGLEYKIANNPNFRPSISYLRENCAGVPDYIVRMVEKSWDDNPKKRPKFVEIRKMIDEKMRTLLIYIKGVDEEDEDAEDFVLSDRKIGEVFKIIRSGQWKPSMMDSDNNNNNSIKLWIQKKGSEVSGLESNSHFSLIELEDDKQMIDLEDGTVIAVEKIIDERLSSKKDDNDERLQLLQEHNGREDGLEEEGDDGFVKYEKLFEKNIL